MYVQYKLGLAYVKIVTNTSTDLKRWVFDSKPESRDRHANT